LCRFTPCPGRQASREEVRRPNWLGGKTIGTEQPEGIGRRQADGAARRVEADHNHAVLRIYRKLRVLVVERIPEVPFQVRHLRAGGVNT